LNLQILLKKILPIQKNPKNKKNFGIPKIFYFEILDDFCKFSEQTSVIINKFCD